MEYYFAYGSNMDLDQMKKRCPNAIFIKLVRLEGYRFVYDGYSSSRNGAVANIVNEEESVVYGALFEIPESDKKNLDKYEGYPHSYKKKYLIVKDNYGNEYEVLVYYREPKEKGNPSEEYKNMVVNAAQKLNLPQNYINKYLKVN